MRLIHDEDFPVLYHILHVAPVERMRLDGGIDVVLEVPVLWIGDVADAEQAFYLFPAHVGNRDGAVLLVDHEVASKNFVLAQPFFRDLLAFCSNWGMMRFTR